MSNPVIDEWAQLGDAQFVLFGTYRTNGELVSTPVWIAPAGDELVVTTTVATGKVKRLRRDDRVVLQPCRRMGEPIADAPVVQARGRVAGAPAENADAQSALRKKYGLVFTAFITLEKPIGRLRGKPRNRVILRLSPASAG